MHQSIPGLRKVSFFEAGEFLNAKKVSHVCPCCSATDSQMIHRGIDPDDEVGYFFMNPATVQPFNPYGQATGSGVLMIAVECSNCGFIRNFSVIRLLEFLTSKEK